MNVSGPINVVRLEGKFNDKTKVLYVFMDHHYHVQSQTECDDIRADEIKHFLAQKFDELDNDKTVDFFYEWYPSMIIQKQQVNKDKYIREVGKLFVKSFTMKDKKVVQSDEFKNVRFHYIDFREFFFNQIHDLFERIRHYVDQIYYAISITLNNILTLEDSLKILESQIFRIYTLLFEEKIKDKIITKPVIPENVEMLSKYTPEDMDNLAKNFMKKIRDDYQDKDLGKKITNLLDNNISKQLMNMIKKIQNLTKYVQSIKSTMTSESYIIADLAEFLDIIRKLMLDIDDINKDEIYTFANITDLYFLRRFLDKSYVTNAISYTGSLHSCFYISFLVKYYNFKITHYSYLSVSVKEAEEIIRKNDYIHKPDDVLNLFEPPNPIQCSNLSGFPKLFE